MGVEYTSVYPTVSLTIRSFELARYSMAEARQVRSMRLGGDGAERKGWTDHEQLILQAVDGRW